MARSLDNKKEGGNCSILIYYPCGVSTFSAVAAATTLKIRLQVLQSLDPYQYPPGDSKALSLRLENTLLMCLVLRLQVFWIKPLLPCLALQLSHRDWVLSSLFGCVSQFTKSSFIQIYIPLLWRILINTLCYIVLLYAYLYILGQY